MMQAMSMNRKQRRLQNKKAGVTKKSRDNMARAEEQKALGMQLRAAGREAEALAPLREALRLNSSLADVHFALAMIARTKPELGIDMGEINKNLSNKEELLKSYAVILEVLRKRKLYNEAKICQEEYCRLLPEDPLALMDLGLIQNLSKGGGEEAILDMARALNMAPDNKIIKSVFATSLHNPFFSTFHPEVKEAFLHCLKNIYDVNLYRFGLPWINLMLRDPLYKEAFKTGSAEDEDIFYQWLGQLDEKSAAFLKDPYLIKGLRMVLVNTKVAESVFTRIRKYLCLNIDKLTSDGRIKLFEKFVFALAEQCFFNEYVYTQSEEETQLVKSYTAEIEKNPDKHKIALVSCYAPLHDFMHGKSRLLHDIAQNDSDFLHLIKTQYEDPETEQKIKGDIPVFGAFANEISRKVQSQYEENPYPRWITFCAHPMPNDDMPIKPEDKYKPLNILVAGCGTGRQPLGAAARHPNAKITAIDLSRASLAYAIRKARESGLADRIKFVHADILSMTDWPDEFDSIECSGVLHHMEDPFEGWTALNSKLKPGGYFKIGLYSETARENIVKAREFIAQNGFPSTIAGIRACRQAIFDLPTTDSMRRYLLESGDFYSTSLVRDLIFHVQEHRMTLPQIKDMMDKLGLKAVKFIMAQPKALTAYLKMFPEDPAAASIDNWALFEEKHPLTFAGMYQFWAQKV